MAIVILLVLGLAIFSNFIFGGDTLLYKDIGSDSINISYPYYVLLSDYLRHFGIPSWSFRVGMGQDLFPYLGMVAFTPVVWLPKAAIAKALVYQHLLYVLVAGFLFLRFFQLRGLTFQSGLLGAILLGFSAYMCMGSCWYFQASEVVAFTFLLFAAENAVSRGHWLYLVLGIVVMGLLSAFHLYLAAVLLCFYVPARLIERYSWSPTSILRTSGLLAAAAVLGLGLGAVLILPNFYSLLNSPRGSGTTANYWTTPSLFQFESTLHYATVLLRPYSNDILGTGNKFRAWANYLEAPVTYCGLLSLLLLPQIFIGAARRQRILYSGLFCLMVLPIIFPWFRYLFWLFQGGYYRAFSLFSIFGVITLSMTAFSRFTEGRQPNLWVLGITLFVLIGVLYLPIGEVQTLIEPGIRRLIVFLLLLYAGLFAVAHVVKRRSLITWTIIALTCLELFLFGRITISKRPVVTKQELTERVGYNDETIEAIKDLKASDSGFFRVTKAWGSGPAVHGSLNDAMVFGYNGTSSYSSFNNVNYIKFLMAVDAIPPSDLVDRAQWSQGLDGHSLLSAFACEKYVLTKNPVAFQTMDYYEFVRNYGKDIYLFRNRLFLPFGLTFTDYISEHTFVQLPNWVKPLVLLNTVVLSDKDTTARTEMKELTDNELERRINDGLTLEVIEQRRDTALKISSFNESSIDGSIETDAKKIMVLQTPFDRGWHAFIDGHLIPTLIGDAGLLGIAVPQGKHIVELRYQPPFLYAGAGISLLSCGILLWGVWRWPRIKLPSALQ